MFYTVFSTNDNPAMQWQSDLLEFSWKEVGQEGTLIRLVATEDPQHLPTQKYAHCVATRLWDVHPDTGDSYPVYNKPASLLEWVFRERPEGTVLLLDPDCVFRRRITHRVAPGSPLSQAWIDFSPGKPGKKRPFGLAPTFSYLAEHCARADIAADPVMIPTLIHTADLRKLCARWLELSGVIRQNHRNAAGQKIWEADMYAYVVACAEYGLHHESASLGICTNWQPEDALDAPIIHYCQGIMSANGKEIFHKYRYRPWAAVDSSLEPLHEYGRDLIGIVNAYVDRAQGIVGPPSLHSRPQRRRSVMEGRVMDDILLELPADDRSLWLNGSGKALWDLCDGSRTIGEIAAALSERFAGDRGTIAADIVMTVGQLRAVGFLELR